MALARRRNWQQTVGTCCCGYYWVGRRMTGRWLAITGRGGGEDELAAGQPSLGEEGTMNWPLFSHNWER